MIGTLIPPLPCASWPRQHTAQTAQTTLRVAATSIPLTESPAARTDSCIISFRDKRRRLINVWTEGNRDLPSERDRRFHS